MASESEPRNPGEFQLQCFLSALDHPTENEILNKKHNEVDGAPVHKTSSLQTRGDYTRNKRRKTNPSPCNCQSTSFLTNREIDYAQLQSPSLP